MAWQQLGELAAPDTPWTVETLLGGLREHVENAPGHGINCACMDQYIRILRRMFGLAMVRPGEGGWDKFDMTAWLESPEHQLRRRIRYILDIVARSDDF